MTLLCPACGAAREIADDALPPEGLTRCDFCRTIFNPRPDAGFSDTGAAEGASAEPESVRDRWFVEVASGVYGPAGKTSIERWIREGRLDWEDLVSHDGGVWLPALEQRRLVGSFHATPEGGATLPEGHPDSEGAPPIKVRPEEITPQQVRRSVRTVATGLIAFCLLTLNLPGVVIGGGLFAMHAWARRGALVLLGFLSLAALAGVLWASIEASWAWAAAGAAAIGLAAAGAAALMRRPVRASFEPGGSWGAVAILVFSTILSTGLIYGAMQFYDRREASRLVAGAGYGYSLTRPSDAWRVLPVPLPVAGHPDADIEIVYAEGRARLLVLLEERRGTASECLADSVQRVKDLGVNPTVYQEQRVSAAGLIGEQGITSVERPGGRMNYLLTCYARGGQWYQVLGIASSRDFDAMRSDLTRMATSLRLEAPADPMRLHIQTRPVSTPPFAETDPDSLAGMVERSEKAVVTITVYLANKRRAYGSGALLGPGGLVVSNYHVIEGAKKIIVGIPDQGSRRALIIARDKKRDLVILKIKGRGLPYLRLATAPLRAGDDVIAIGSPMGLSHTVTKGIISSTRRVRNGVNYLQADASINPGNSGGPLLNLQGEVIGINTFIVRESDSIALTGLNFALPASYVREIIEDAGFSLPGPPVKTTAFRGGTGRARAAGMGSGPTSQ